MARPSGEPRAEWVDFLDPDDGWTWRFDVSFLLSGYSCIFGRGCPGTELKGNGCCADGAYLTDAEDDTEGMIDFRKVDEAAAKLTAEEWQFKDRGDRLGWWTHRGNARHTRIHKGACIFANREGFEGGVGCALHIGAMNRGERPLDWKPFICWLVPLQTEDDSEMEIRWVRHYEHERDWGGHEKWWCTSDERAYGQHSEPYFRQVREELIELCGEQVHAMLAAYLEERYARMAGPCQTPVQPSAVFDD